MLNPTPATTPVAAPLVRPSDTRMLALASAAESKLQNLTGDAQFEAFFRLSDEEHLSWILLHT